MPTQAPSSAPATSKLPDTLSTNDFLSSEPPAPRTDQPQDNGNIFSTIGNALISSEKGLGQDIAGALPSWMRGEPAVARDQQNVQDMQTRVMQQIQKNKAAGKDTTQLESALKQTMNQPDVAPEAINPALAKTNTQVLGDVGGTALDTLTAGTLSAGAKSFKLMTAAERVAQAGKLTEGAAIAKNIEGTVPTTWQALAQVGKDYLKNAAVYGGIGYGYDVTGSMQNNKPDLTPGWGTAIGAVIPGIPALSKAGEVASNPAAETIINSLVKPLLKDFSYGKNPGRAVSQSGITASNMEELAQKIGDARQQTGQEIGSVSRQLDAGLGRGAIPGVSQQKGLNIAGSLAPIDSAMQEAAKTNNPSLLGRLQGVKDALVHTMSLGKDELGNPSILKGPARQLEDLSFADTFNFKKMIGDMTKWTGNPSDDQLINKALKGAYGNIKEAIDTRAEQINSDLAAKLRKLNEKYADLTSAEIATKYRDKIEMRQNIMKFAPTLMGMGGLAGSLLTGNALPALIGLGAAGVDKALGSTLVKTHVAAWLAKEDPGVIDRFMRQYPQIADAIYRAFHEPFGTKRAAAAEKRAPKPLLALPAPKGSIDHTINNGLPIPVAPTGRAMETTGNKTIAGSYTAPKAPDGTPYALRNQLALPPAKGPYNTANNGLPIPIVPRGTATETTGNKLIAGSYNAPKEPGGNPSGSFYDRPGDLPTIPMGPKAPKTPSNLPTVDSESKPKVFSEPPKKSVPAPKPIPVYKGEKDLTLKTLEDLKGRATVSKEFIENALKRQDIRQPEREAMTSALKDFGSTVPVKELADKVRTDLLPLTRRTIGKDGSEGISGSTKYGSVVLPDSIRGNIQNYAEHVYNSPVKTTGANVHFNTEKDPGYFAHTRTEDMPGDTRRVLELQSDLMQKGRLEREKQMTQQQYEYLKNKAEALGDNNVELLKHYEEVSKLQPYENTWHERIIREEIKQAAKDGKKALQFPTGDTAMKIEGLGTNANWYVPGTPGIRTVPYENIKPGQELHRGGDHPSQNWVVTNVLGDGKFKAMPSDWQDRWEEFAGNMGTDKNDKTGIESYKNHLEESFDISGRQDTSNPIHKFYEKTVGKYLQNKMGAKLVTDPQGVTWWQVPISKDMAKAPVVAHGFTTPGTLTKASAGSLAAFLGARGTKEGQAQPLPQKQGPVKLNFGTKTPEIRGQKFDDATSTQAVNTILSEVSNRMKPVEVTAMLNVAVNAAKAKGISVQKVLTDPNFFQGLTDKRYKAASSGKLAPGDQKVKDFVQKTVQDAITKGLPDHTGGATHFVHITTGKNKDSVVTMTEKEFTRYLRHTGMGRDLYAESLI